MRNRLHYPTLGTLLIKNSLIFVNSYKSSYIYKFYIQFFSPVDLKYNFHKLFFKSFIKTSYNISKITLHITKLLNKTNFSLLVVFHKFFKDVDVLYEAFPCESSSFGDSFNKQMFQLIHIIRRIPYDIL